MLFSTIVVAVCFCIAVYCIVEIVKIAREYLWIWDCKQLEREAEKRRKFWEDIDNLYTKKMDQEEARKSDTWYSVVDDGPSFI